MPLFILKILAVLVFSYVLNLITQRIVKSLTYLSSFTKLGQFATTAIIMSLATSLPEISVAISAATNQLSILSLGDALGSNIVNLSLVIGITAIVGKSLHFNHDQENKSAFLPLLYTLLPLLFLLDGRIGRTEGFILVASYLVYIFSLIRKPHHHLKKMTKGDLETKALKKAFKTTRELALSVTFLIAASQAIIWISKSLAQDLGLPILFIGFFIIAIGTSLPELVFSLKATKERKITMALGNIIGSCVTNATLIIGIAAIIYPIVVPEFQTILLPMIEYIFIAILFTFFTFSKHRLDRWEGAILIGLFLFYTCLELA